MLDLVFWILTGASCPEARLLAVDLQEKGREWARRGSMRAAKYWSLQSTLYNLQYPQELFLLMFVMFETKMGALIRLLRLHEVMLVFTYNTFCRRLS